MECVRWSGFFNLFASHFSWWTEMKITSIVINCFIKSLDLYLRQLTHQLVNLLLTFIIFFSYLPCVVGIYWIFPSDLHKGLWFFNLLTLSTAAAKLSWFAIVRLTSHRKWLRWIVSTIVISIIFSSKALMINFKINSLCKRCNV